MNLNFINELLVPMTVLGCLVIGYVTKKWINDVDNKYIPTICAVSGIVLNCLIATSFSIETIVVGAVSGLASTGLHQAFTRIIEKGDQL